MEQMKTLTINNKQFDIYDDEAVRFTEQTLTDEQKAQVRENIGIDAGFSAGINMEPAEDDIPILYFGAEFPKTKLYAKMSFRYVSNTMDVSGYCHTRAQGNYSMRFDKKNQTIKLYKDASCTKKLKIEFKDWGEQSKFVIKANWVDPTHARNIVCANLWDEVVDSRSDYDAIPEELRNSPRNGAVDGFPVKVYADGIYQGVYTMNIPKDDWMVGMDEDNPNHVLLCAETNTNGVYSENPCNFRALWDGTDGLHWSVEVGSDINAAKNSLNALITCVKDTDDATFLATIGNHLDVQSAIDYYLFQYVINGTDGLAKNMLLATYDGAKWYCSAYDMDGTFFPPTDNPCPGGYGEQYSKLWERITTLYPNELTERYKELRESVLTYSNMVGKFEDFIGRIGTELYEGDREVFPNLPNDYRFTLKHFREYIHGRLAYCDTMFGRADEPRYELAEELVTSTDPWYYEDTQIKLFDKPRTFTIICEATAKSLSGYQYIWACTNGYDTNISSDSAEGRACLAAYISNGGIQFIGVQDTFGNPIWTDGNWNGSIITSLYSKVVLVVTEGVPTALYYITEKGSKNVQTPARMASGLAYKQHEGTVVLGGNRFNYGVDKLFNGTIHQFKILDHAMSEDEAYAEFGAEKPDVGAENPDDRLLYRIDNPITVDSAAWTGHVVTDVKLFDEPKSFTILCEVNVADNCKAGMLVWSCTNEHLTFENPPIGKAYLQARAHSEGGLYFTGYPNTNGWCIFGETGAGKAAIPSRYSKHAVVVENGIPTKLYYMTEDNGTVHSMDVLALQATMTYIQHDGVLTIGCARYDYGNNHLFDGTIHALEVWDFAMTAAEVERKLRGL